MIALCALCVLALGQETVQPDWTLVWRDAEELLAMDADAPGRTDVLATIWERHAAAPASLERDLLAGVLRHAEGVVPGVAAPAADAPWPFDPEASWLAAVVLPAGPDRARAVAAALTPLALEEPGALALRGERLQRAWESWLLAATELRFEDALAIGRPVHRDAQADWSALSLALTLTRAGAYQEADEVLAGRIAGGGDRAALWTQRGIVALGAGDGRRARWALGTAILSDSVDAMGVAARLDLASGRRRAARAGFRSALLRPEPGPWARRGWGLALLPARTGLAPGGPAAQSF